MADNLARFDPFAGLEALRREFLDSGLLGTLRGRVPTTDVYTEDDTGLVVEVHLPNFEEKDISVSVDKGALAIQAERHEREEDKSRKYVVRESSSSFFRSISLPDQADVQNIKADYTDGVLKVTVPLAEITAPTKIQIGSGDGGK